MPTFRERVARVATRGLGRVVAAATLLDFPFGEDVSAGIRDPVDAMANVFTFLNRRTLEMIQSADDAAIIENLALICERLPRASDLV
jgi:hypothetical protein